MKKVEITDEEEIQKKRFIDLYEDGDFWVDEAFLDPETYEFRLVGVWTKMPDEKGNRKEVRAEIEGRLNPKDFEKPWGRELTGTLSDVIEPEWLDWTIDEI